MEDEYLVDNPATLVAIAIAARRSGNRELERAAKRKLEQEFKIKINFAKNESTEGNHGLSRK